MLFVPSGPFSSSIVSPIYLSVTLIMGWAIVFLFTGCHSLFYSIFFFALAMDGGRSFMRFSIRLVHVEKYHLFMTCKRF